jgi:hypothetical protein
MGDISGWVMGLLFVLGFILFVLLIQTFFLWMAAKFLKFKEQSFVKALIVTIVQNVAAMIIGVVLGLLIGIMGLISPILTLIGWLFQFAISILAQSYIIKNMYDENWSNSFVAFIISKIVIAIILIVLIIGVVMWQLGVFNAGNSDGVVAKDWAKLKPVSPSIIYEAPEQEFQTAFQNVAGTSIQITSASVQETTSGVTCSPVLINDAQITGNGVKVAPGSVFEVSATCSDAGKNNGDQYSMEINLEYNAVIGGITTKHNEAGSIRGTVE